MMAGRERPLSPNPPPATTQSSPRTDPSGDVTVSAAGSRSWTSFLIPSVADVLFCALLFGLSCGALGRLLLRDADIGWHIRDGEQIFQTHAVPRTDSFSSTMSGHTWYAWEWLYDLLIAFIHHAFGLNGVVFSTAILIAATFVLAFYVTLRRNSSLLVSLLLLIVSLGAASVHFLARPHVVSWLFTVAWFSILDSERDSSENRKRLRWLPVLMILWANLHGGFVLGFALLGIYLIGGTIDYFRHREQRYELRQWLQLLGTTAVLTFFASFLNPYGYHLHLHIYRYLSDRFLMNQISEFLAPDFHGGAQQCFAVLLIIAIVTVAAAKRTIGSSRLLLLLFAAYSGCYATRNLPTSSLLITLVIAPVLSESISQAAHNVNLAAWLRATLQKFDAFSSRMQNLEFRLRGHAWIVAALALGLWATLHQGRIGSTPLIHAYFDSKRLPVDAADFISAHHLREPIFSVDYWGGYLIYRLYPETKVVVDDRHDLYGDQFFRDYLSTVLIQSNWETFLDSLHVDWILMPSNSTLANMLRLTPEWSIVHQDSTAVLFHRMTQPAK
jgi:hypothetical protein